MRLPLLLLCSIALLAGCSGGSGDVSKKDDDELRHNFTRKLTPEEIAKLGGPHAAAPDKNSKGP